MKKDQFNLINIIFIWFFFTSFLYAQFFSFETEHVRILYYDTNHRYLISHLARCFENSFAFHSNLFNYQSAEKVNILCHDLSDYGTGGATTVPWNYVIVALEPFDYVYETSPTNERMNWLMHHELAHIVAMDKAVGLDRNARKIFLGKVEPTAENPITIFYTYLTNPRRYAPRWFHEGIAVFLETWMAGGLGRVLGGYDEMVFRTMIYDDSYFYDIVGLESEGTTIDFQIGANSYLYGARFVTYLANQYGPEKILEWFNRTEQSKRYFANQFKQVYGRSLDEEWSHWIRWENQWQKKNLESVQTNPTTPYRNITKVALGSVSRAFYDPGVNKIYTAILYPGSFAYTTAIDVGNGKIEKICEVPSPALYYVSALAYDYSSGNLFYTTDNSRAWRDLNCVNVRDGKSKLLLKDARVGDLAFNSADQALWGVQHHNGLSIVVRFLPPYNQWQNILQLSYGKDIFDLDISPDGKYLTASLIEISGRQRLIRMEIEKLLQANDTFEVLFEFEDNAPANFVYSPDGKSLFGTSYYSGVSNVYRYDFETREMNLITNTETGFFRPVVVSSDSIIVFRYTGDGFVPAMISCKSPARAKAIRLLGQEIVNRYSVVKQWKVGSPVGINLDSLTTYDGIYHALNQVKIASAYPIVEGYKDFPAYGLRFNLQDPLGLYTVQLSASYSPNNLLPADEKFHLNVKLRHWPWMIRAIYNRADFYDLFGPTKVSRKGNALTIGYEGSLISELPKTMNYTLQLSGYNNLERLPDYQNVLAPFDRYMTLNTSLSYSFLRSSLGAIEKEKGTAWEISLRYNYVNAKFITLIHANFNYGFILPLDHSSIWMRGSSGYAFGDQHNPFANFYFGGFGNNWIDYLTELRYREYYSFPGVEINKIGGTNFIKLLMEWTLPPLRFRRFGFTSLYLRWSRLVLFSSTIISDYNHDLYRRKFINLGGQLDSQLVIFSMLNSTFSLGYAIAIEENQRLSTEFMISLKIL